ncbi:type I restriction endonuclease subunit R [Flammeovirga sp. MY04]|uniref:type I restriction endonuclease subunit R n=1 Tax=Flammeovirga sp. MY04 TaxID=1191459 RepID=UPI0008061382|nr:type I restriction endonuclease [Flammeovirga sp. MY04]ANQ51578.1 type I restriction endonuclease subunit R [Flammeovirga sp. MY04]
MSNPEFIQSEQPAIELLSKLGYTYLDGQKDDTRSSINEVLFEEKVKDAIKRLNPWLQEQQVNQAFREVTFKSYESLMEVNEQFWKRVLCKDEFTTQLEDLNDPHRKKKDVRYIDFDHPENNEWIVTNQLKFKGSQSNSIPDIVVYVNGFPLAVMECKSAKASGAIDKAISDMQHYQRNSERLFVYNFICAGMCKWQARYGAINAPSQFYSRYRIKDEREVETFLGRKVSEQDIMLYYLFRKDLFLDIYKYFTLFELSDGKKIKKLPRYQQIRATNNTINSLSKDRGGVVWATQGSGKSITMGYVTRKLQAEEFGFENPTIIVLTDRKDLDRQITNTFQNIGLKNVKQATSVAGLKDLLRNDYGQIITTTIQKFQETDDEGNIIRTRKEKQKDGSFIFFKEIINPEGELIHEEIIKESEAKGGKLSVDTLSQKKNIYVLIDEAHRTQYGLLASFMRKALPHAKFVAFTGTPLSKEDKSTLGTFYGGDYLDVYTIKEAVEDGATLPLLYEQGLPQYFIDKEVMDQAFDEEFGHESQEKQKLLQKEAGKKIKSANERLEAIVDHLLNHYKTRIYPDGLKAMLVCENRANAIAYKKIFERKKEEGAIDFNTRVVMSFSLKKDPPEYFELATPSEEVKDAVENYKLPFGDENDIEKSGKLKFNNDGILIVSDMLLTGYDAPIAGVLYLDKNLKEHTLLQALARVNRTRKGKHAGIIVDYYGIANNLIQALEIFGGEMTREEIIPDLESEFPKLEQRHEKLIQLFKGVKVDRNYEREKYIDQAVRILEPLDIRDDFKDLLKKFNESIAIVTPHPKAVKYKKDVKLFNEIRLQARNMYPEDDTLKISPEESAKLKALIDEHLHASGVKDLLEEPVSIMDQEKFKQELDGTLSPESKAKKIANRARHVIKVGMNNNPDFYKPLGELLEELIKQQEENRISQLELFQKIQEQVIDKIENKDNEANNLGLNHQEFAVYSTLGTQLGEDAVEVTKEIFEVIQPELGIVDWQNKFAVLKDIEKKIRKVLRGKMEKEVYKEMLPVLVDLIKKNG